MKIPMLNLKREYEYMKADIDAAIARCLEHQQWILGPEVKEFEDKVAEYLGVKHCIGTSSGTDALVLSLRALAIKTKGQEYFDRSDLIITTPFTFTATGDAILRAGATPAFVDIDPLTYNIDPVQIRAFLAHPTPSPRHYSTTQRRNHSTKVVGLLPVHLYGQSCQMEEIMSIADEHGLFVLEDVAQAFGGEWREASGARRKLGSLGTVGCFSFFPSKNLGGFGDGGMVSTNDDEIAELVRMLLKHGGKDKYNVDHIGYNARLDTLQAAVLLAKLKYVDEFNSRRRCIAQLYIDGFADIPGIVLPVDVTELKNVHEFPKQPPNLCATQQSANLTTQRPNDATIQLPNGHCFHQFTVRALNGQRDQLQSHLKQSGIDSMVYYPVPLHKMKVFEGRSIATGELNEAKRAAGEVISLPIEPLQSEDATQYVVQCLRLFAKENPSLLYL